MHFLLYVFYNELLLAIYLICILDYGNDVRQKANLRDFLIGVKSWVIKQQRQLVTPTMHLAQELLMNVQWTGNSRSFAKETRVLKMRSAVASHWKLTTTNWEAHWSWSTYNYTRSFPRIQHQPFYGCLASEAHWKCEKVQWVGASSSDHKSKRFLFWSVIFVYST